MSAFNDNDNTFENMLENDSNNKEGYTFSTNTFHKGFMANNVSEL